MNGVRLLTIERATYHLIVSFEGGYQLEHLYGKSRGCTAEMVHRGRSGCRFWAVWATRVATVLRGKHKPTYTPHCDTGDYVIVINAGQGSADRQKAGSRKIYYHHSGFPGGLSETPYRKLMNEKPEFAVKKAIVGMLPQGPAWPQHGKETARLRRCGTRVRGAETRKAGTQVRR